MMKKIHTKVVLLITILFLAIFGGIIYMQFPFEEEIVSAEEQAKREIDEYNFEQLKKAKEILKTIPKNANRFYTLKEFNSQYNANIRPTKNCYYVSNRNGHENYIFGFKLESEKYIEKYGNQYLQKYGSGYYVYPTYDLPAHEVCTGVCWDIGPNYFLTTVSNPCEE